MEKGVVRFIDQNRLPFHFSIGESRNYRQSCSAIVDMTVRGAGAIGALGGFAMAQAFLEAPKSHNAEFLSAAKEAIVKHGWDKASVLTKLTAVVNDLEYLEGRNRRMTARWLEALKG